MVYDKAKDFFDQCEYSLIEYWQSEFSNIHKKFEKEYWRIFSPKSLIISEKEKANQIIAGLRIFFWRMNYNFNEIEIKPLYSQDLIDYVKYLLQEVHDLLENEFETVENLYAEYKTNSAWAIENLENILK